MPKGKKRTKKDPILSRIGDRTFAYIIGVDEVGWGAIAGPIGIGVAVLPWDYDNSTTKWKDSKKYSSENAREKAFESVSETVLHWDIRFVSLEDMEKYGPGKALRYGMLQLVKDLKEQFPNALIVVDGKLAIPGIPDEDQIAVPSADNLVPAVSAASIVAKVTRDRLMCSLHPTYPAFDFNKNKGYPTPIHLLALKTYGATVVHRTNILIVSAAIKDKGFYEAVI